MFKIEMHSGQKCRKMNVPFKSTYSFFTFKHKKFTERFKHSAISVCLLKHQFGSEKSQLSFVQIFKWFNSNMAQLVYKSNKFQLISNKKKDSSGILCWFLFSSTVDIFPIKFLWTIFTILTGPGEMNIICRKSTVS